MRKLHIDIETFGDRNLNVVGVHKYAETCEILMLAYSYDDDPEIIVDLTKDCLPSQILRDLKDPLITKYAHNAAFERTCLSAFFAIQLPPSQWICSMALCASASLPLSLENAAKILKVDAQKDKIGKSLIDFFTKPCKPTKTNGGRIRNLPESAPERWEQFKQYCMQDVRAEKAVIEALSFIRIPKFEKRVWDLDQQINDRGVNIDMGLVKNALKLNDSFRTKVLLKATELTGIVNPNSRNQLIAWLESETDSTIANLQKAQIPVLLEKFDSAKVKQVLGMRETLSKTSVKKYDAMATSIGEGGRVRGLFQYCGAGRTGRWGGRKIQPQNLPKGQFSSNDDLNHLFLDTARKMLSNNEGENLELHFDAMPITLSKLIRTAFIPKAGHRFIISDYSAIEARVIAWLGNERWRLEIFKTHGKIYEASASQMFKVPIEEVTKGSPYRARGKIAELALGYAGGPGALIKMIAQENIKGIEETELKPIITAWRSANPNIVKLWKTCDNASKHTIRTGERVTIDKGIHFEYRHSNLIITLPSGRKLYYPGAGLRDSEYGKEVFYYGLDQKIKKWVRLKTYGGKLVENITQAVARDILANGMICLYEAGYNTVLHVHDETVNEVPIGIGSLKEVNELMISRALWMGDLPLRADGFESFYYKKD